MQPKVGTADGVAAPVMPLDVAQSNQDPAHGASPPEAAAAAVESVAKSSKQSTPLRPKQAGPKKKPPATAGAVQKKTQRHLKRRLL